MDIKKTEERINCINYGSLWYLNRGQVRSMPDHVTHYVLSVLHIFSLVYEENYRNHTIDNSSYGSQCHIVTYEIATTVK